MSDPTEAIQAGLAGQAAVLADNVAWKADAVLAVQALARGYEGTFEDIRILVTPLCGKPSHHNAWGALAGALKRSGVLMDTGRLSHMATKRSHGRKTPVLRRA